MISKLSRTTSIITLAVGLGSAGTIWAQDVTISRSTGTQLVPQSGDTITITERGSMTGFSIDSLGKLSTYPPLLVRDVQDISIINNGRLDRQNAEAGPGFPNQNGVVHIENANNVSLVNGVTGSIGSSFGNVFGGQTTLFVSNTENFTLLNEGNISGIANISNSRNLDITNLGRIGNLQISASDGVNITNSSKNLRMDVRSSNNIELNNTGGGVFRLNDNRTVNFTNDGADARLFAQFIGGTDIQVENVNGAFMNLLIQDSADLEFDTQNIQIFNRAGSGMVVEIGPDPRGRFLFQSLSSPSRISDFSVVNEGEILDVLSFRGINGTLDNSGTIDGILVAGREHNITNNGSITALALGRPEFIVSYPANDFPRHFSTHDRLPLQDTLLENMGAIGTIDVFASNTEINNSGTITGLDPREVRFNGDTAPQRGGTLFSSRVNEARTAALLLSGSTDTYVRNSGSILSDLHQAIILGRSTTIMNSLEGIVSGSTGIMGCFYKDVRFNFRLNPYSCATQTSHIENSGLIEGTTNEAILTTDGQDTVINRGRILSPLDVSVDLRAGDDRFEAYTGSEVSGQINGGDGTDIFVLRGDESTAQGLFDIAQPLNFEDFLVLGSDWRLNGTNGFVNGVRIAGGAQAQFDAVTLTATDVMIDADSGLEVIANSLIGGNLTNAGTLAINDPLLLTVDGNFMASASSVTRFGFLGASSGMMDVNGLATFSESSTVFIDVGAPETSLVDKMDYRLLNGSVTNLGAAVEDNSAMFDFIANWGEGGLSVTADKLLVLNDVAGPSQRLGNIATLLDGLLDAPDAGALNAVFARAETDEALAQTLEDVAPDNGFGTALLAMGHMQGSFRPQFTRGSAAGPVKVASLDSTGMGSHPKSEASTWIWGIIAKGDATSDGNANFAGFEGESDLVQAGIERGKAGHHIGAMVSYQSSDIDGTGLSAGDQTEISSWGVSAYGGYNVGQILLDASGTLGWHDFDMARTFALINERVTGQFDGQSHGLTLKASRPIAMNQHWKVTPSVGLDYQHLKTNAYTETGSILALSYNAAKQNQPVAFVGAKLSGELKTGSSVFTPDLGVKLGQNIGDRDFSQSVRFVAGGGNITVTSPDFDRDYIGLSTGLGVAISHSSKLRGFFEYTELNGVENKVFGASAVVNF